VVLPGYAHLDALIGRDAWRDVYPVISGHLDRRNP
jgi:cholesterol oxidase